MAITDVFKTKQFKSDIERLTAENSYLNSLLTPNMKNAVSINAEIQRLNAEKASVQASIEDEMSKRQALAQEIHSLNEEIEKKKTPSFCLMMRYCIRISGYTPLSTT